MWDPASRTWNAPLTEPVYNNELQRKYFTLTAQAAREAGPYDIIVIGTGMGGGVLAGDLFDTNSELGDGAKKILVIEKGDLVFHSYCLNSARPGGSQKDRGHQNGIFYLAFKSDYVVEGEKESWKGGPMYCLGGRSTTWGLYAPRMHDTALRNCFTETVATALTSEFYEKAESLMNLGLPPTKPVHQHVMERLNMDEAGRAANVQWQWGRSASEFRYGSSVRGAFSTVDKLLEIATSKPKGQAEHQNFKILLGTDVREIVWMEAEADGVAGKTAEGVKIRSRSGEDVVIQLEKEGKVVLCAGSVASPAILLRSGADLPSNDKVALKDHEIFYKTRSFRYLDPRTKLELGPIKLQTYVSLGKESALANLCLDSSGFLPRAQGVDDNIPKFVITFTTRRSLDWKGEVRLNDDREPVVHISARDGEPHSEAEIQEMAKITDGAIKAVADTLKLEFLEEVLSTESGAETQNQLAEQFPDADQPVAGVTENYFRRLRMGVVGHEMGTLPMTPGKKSGTVDEDLALRSHKGVYICDLSTFRGLPDANPSLTLAALSIRLSRFLLPRVNLKGPEENELKIVNHSGDVIEVWVSDQRDDAVAAADSEGNIQLGPGKDKSWTRNKHVPEAVFIFRRDPRVDGTPIFFKEPEVVVGFPGSLLPIM
ncbi:hypothetical protein FRB90_002904 [Tulasnella sp. 427]|nr:hypothetical protein FRB90_002904 [Tulasnella sp. 427]